MQRQYPRPQLKRDHWINLNGEWAFDFDDEVKGFQEKWYERHQFSKKIIVPFPYQSKLSGINDTHIHDHVWYQRNFEYYPHHEKRIIMHFAAVDYESVVFINGQMVGKHIGGSTSFNFDITDFLYENGNQTVTLYVFDPTLDAYISRGKQAWREKPFECFYDRTTGIWQTVWLEEVHPSGLDYLKIMPDLDHKQVRFEIYAKDAAEKSCELDIFYQGKSILHTEAGLMNKGCITIDIEDENLHPWSPEDPALYDVKLTLKREHKVVDVVESYFGIKKISIEGKHILLNNKPYYLRLVLDQGYYPDGLLSYPNEDDLLNDIRYAKLMGFNGCRKHEKIEAERWMYYADREGYLVSLEMPSQYAYKANNAFVEEWLEAVKRDFNHPSLFMYVPFNESWGVRNIKNSKEQQDYVTSFYYLTKSLDSSRIVISNDGWEQTVTEVCTVHTYNHGKLNDQSHHELFKKSLHDLDTLLSPIHTKHDRHIYVGQYYYHGEPILLSEFGGISYAPQTQVGWGYTGVESSEDFINELRRIFRVVYSSPHFAGFCYTQITDVMQEINGFLSYDRKIKIPFDTIKKIVCNEE